MPTSNPEIIAVLKSAGIIAIPTDTVIGLAIDPKNRMAVQKIYRLKQRDRDKPLVYMFYNVEQIREYVEGITPEVEDIMRKYWPGALTIIFRIKDSSDTVGVRIPNNKFLLDLLKDWGRGLAVTSANISGEKELNSLAEIQQKFGRQIDLYIDTGAQASGQASTVLDVSSGTIKVLRQGEVKI